MSALRDLQTGFRSFLISETDAAPGIAGGFADNAAIYRNNVHHTHVSSLQANFPSIQALVGDAFFDTLALDYANNHPPYSAILAQYGSEFPAYLAKREELSPYPFLPDVARLEWALNEAFHAHSSFSLTPADAARVFSTDTGETPLTLLSSARLVSSRFRIRDICDAALEGNAERIAGLASETQNLLVMRPDAEVVIAELSDGEYAFLKALAGNASLDGALNAAIAADPSLSPAEAVGRLLHLGVFVAPEPSRQEPKPCPMLSPMKTGHCRNCSSTSSEKLSPDCPRFRIL